MKRTRYLTSLAAVAAVLAMAACGSTDTPDTATPAGGASPKSGETLKMAFIPQITGIPYYAGFEAGAQKAAAEFGVEFKMSGPSTANSAEQLRIFESLVQQGYDAISISPLDPTSINSAITKAREKGVVVTTSDADAATSDRQVFVSQATDEDLGFTVMDSLAEQMGNKGQFGIVSGAPDTASLDAWAKFIQERAKSEYPDIEFVGGVRNATDSALALKEAQNLMTAFPDIKGIVAVPSTAVPGVSQAVQNAGKAGEVAVIGYGSPKTAGPFIESGVMKETVLWDVPELGYLTVWANQQLVEGKSFEAENTVPGIDRPIAYDEATKTLLLGPPKIFDKSNYAQFDY